MDDTKLYGRRKKELDSSFQRVRVFSENLEKEIKIGKCAMLNEKTQNCTVSIELFDGKVNKSLQEGEN